VSDCLFCSMVAGDIPVQTVYEDEYVIAFDDIAPQAPVHTLVVPRTHVVNLNDDVSDELLAAVFRAVPKVAAAKGVKDSGYRILVNNGAYAGQTVQHLHVHLFGGARLGHGMVNLAEE